MDEGLLKERSAERGRRWRETWEEAKKLCYLAAPMAAVTLSFFLVTVISLMMVGHLGELALSSSAIAISFTGVTGFSVILGMASALETTSGQAFGAQQYEKVGTQTYTAIVSLLFMCIPLSLLWIYMGDLLKLVGQDPQISQEAGRFSVCLIPTLFGYAVLEPLVRYFQMQSLTAPLLVHHALHPRARVLGLYMRYSPDCRNTRSPISSKIFEIQGMKEFFRFAVPSAVMVCLEWWSYELMILMSGLLPNPQLESSVLSVCLNSISTVYAIPFGFGAAASTRISNELGAGRPEGARLSVRALALLAGVNALVISSCVFASRSVFGYIFSNEKEVVEYVAYMAPLLCLSIIIDNVQGCLSGVARGCGWQHIGAYINLASFYLFGLPIAIALTFWLDFRGMGLWIGILSGATLQTILLSLITIFTNWEKQAAEARERLFQEESSLVNRLS
ncbi:protein DETOXIFICATION 14-like [Salvia divinorum]|uniref:Protein DETOXIFICATION n=1 Tax=Salvia divinorum TaxID=28513 RepID=A0ABD1FJ68_SALDI